MRELEPLQTTPVTMDPVVAVLTQVTSPTDGPSIATGISVALGRLTQYVQRYGLAVVGAPRAIYTAYGDRTTTFTVAFPIAFPSESPPPTAHVTLGELPAFDGWRFVHVGSYETLPTTYARITEWLLAQGVIESEHDWAHILPMWEEYVSDPPRTPASELVTYVHVPRPGAA